MKRFATLTLFLVLVLATSASAWTVHGGTAAQQAYAREVLESSRLDMMRVDRYFAGGIKIRIEEHWEPYWIPTELEATAAGLAYSTGEVIIDASLAPGYNGYFGEVVAHELVHLDWYALGRAGWTAWGDIAGPGGDTWLTNRAENYAETAKVYAYPPQYLRYDYARTDLHVASETTFWEFHNTYTGGDTRPTTTTLPPSTTSTTAPPVTTTTTVRGDPFKDITREDSELWVGAWWGRSSGVWQGYPNGHFEPGQNLTRHQVALIADRWIGVALPTLLADWGPATRGDVRDALPGLPWLEERWSESITRSQLLRLQYRGELQ